MSFLLVQLLTGLSSAAVLFLVSSGLSLIFGVTRILNFAHGSLYMIGAYIAYTLVQHLGGDGLNFWLALLLAAVAVGLIGTLLEMFVLRRIYGSPELFQLLATFALVLVFQDIALHTWGPEDLLGPQAPGLGGGLQMMGESFPLYDMFLIVMAAVIISGLYWLLHRTRFGTLVRAATEDREMVANLGVNQKWLFTAVFALGSFLAGLGGALQIPRESVSLTMDMSMIIEAFVVVVIGGMGSLRGAGIASLIVGLTQAFGILILPEITLVLLFIVMAIVLVIKPYGLYGEAEDQMVEKTALSSGAVRPPPSFMPYVWVGLALVLGALPYITDGYFIVLVGEILIMAVFAASLHFILGTGGLGVFGHALYFGLGAYAVALLTHYTAASLPMTLVAAPMLAVAAVLIFGWFCIRSQGIYLAMLTFAFAQMVWAVAFQWYAVTGGDNGMLGVWPAGQELSAPVFYWVVLSLCGSLILLLRHLIFSPFGYSLRAARDHSRRAEAIGLNIMRLHWIGLAISGGFAGLAGGLFAYAKGSVFPTTLDIGTTLDAFVMTLLGGLHTISGPLLGSVIYISLESEISRYTEFWRAILGVFIILIVIFLPNGISGWCEKMWKSTAFGSRLREIPRRTS